MDLDPAAVKPRNASIRALLDEAEAAARFAEQVWEPKDGQPGLRDVQELFGGRDLIDELYSLARAARSLDLERRVPKRPDRAAAQRLEQARRLLVDLDSACEAVITVDQLKAAGRTLAQARARRRSPSEAVLAQALKDIAGLADTLRDRLGRLDLDLSLIEQARLAADALGSADKPNAVAERRRARDLRDRILTLADQRVRELVAACGFVFRHHPELRRAARRARFRS
jgi:hypothetical protein